MGGLGSGNSDNMMMLRSLLLVHHVWGFIVSTFFLSFFLSSSYSCVPGEGLICACGARFRRFFFFSYQVRLFFSFISIGNGMVSIIF